MKNIISNRLLIIMSFLIISCSNQEGVNKSHKEVIKINTKDLTAVLSQNDMIDTLWQIPLDGSKNALINETTSFYANLDYFYIFDYSLQTVFIFNRSGNLVNKIDKDSDGLNNSGTIETISLTKNNEVVLHDPEKSYNIYYNSTGQFIKKNKLNPSVFLYNMYHFDNKLLYITDLIINFPEYNEFRLYVQDTATKVIEGFMPRQQKATLKSMRCSDDYFSSVFSSEIYFQFPFVSNIYTFKNGKISLKYEVDLGEKAYPKETYYMDNLNYFKNKFVSNDIYMTILGGIKYSENYLVIPYFSNWEFKAYSVYSKKSGKNITYGDIYLDELGTKLPRPELVLENDVFVGYLKDNLSSDDRKTALKNPTLLLFKYKEF
jgi:uncharacterized protein YcfL